MTMIKPVIERSVSSFELTPEANREYNSRLQARFTDSIFTLCSSWYRLNKDGKVISIFPGSYPSQSSFYIVWSFLRIIHSLLVVVSKRQLEPLQNCCCRRIASRCTEEGLNTTKYSYGSFCMLNCFLSFHGLENQEALMDGRDAEDSWIYSEDWIIGHLFIFRQ